MRNEALCFCLTFLCGVAVGQELPAVYRSIDAGDHWQPVEGLPVDIQVNDVTENDGMIFLATESHGVYVSENGKDWHASHKGLSSRKIDALGVFHGNVYAGTFERGIYLSQNGGASWSPLSEGLSNLTVRKFYVFEGRLLAGTNDGVFIWTGHLWKQLYGQLQVNDFSQVGHTLFVATHRGVLLSSGALQQWKLVAEGTAIRSFHVGAMPEARIGSTYFSEKLLFNDKGFVGVANFPGVPVSAFHPLLVSNGFVISRSAEGFFRSDDSGKTWRKIGNGLDNALPIKLIKNTNRGLYAVTGSDGC